MKKQLSELIDDLLNKDTPEFGAEFPPEDPYNISVFSHHMENGDNPWGFDSISFTSYDIKGERLYCTREGLVHREPVEIADRRTDEKRKVFMDKLCKEILEKRRQTS